MLPALLICYVLQAHVVMAICCRPCAAGSFYLPLRSSATVLNELPVDKLPGVGWKMHRRLQDANITTCGQLSAHSKESVQKIMGAKVGAMVYNLAIIIQAITI